MGGGGRRRRLHRGGRKRQHEARPLARTGGEHQVAARLAGDLSRNVESQARAAACLGRGERPEQPRHHVRGDAAGVVLDGHRDPVLLAPGIHRELAGGLDRPQGIDRVGQEIDDHLLQLDRVPEGGDQRRIQAPAHRDLVECEPVGHEVHGPAHHIVQVDARDFPLRDPDEPEQAAQELRGATRLPQDLEHLGALRLRQSGIGDAVLRMRRDGHERVVDLVGHAGEQLPGGGEAALLLRAIPQHPRHFVEVLRQPAQLVAAAHRHARRQIAFCDPGEPGLELRERPPHAPAHEGDRGDHADGAQGEPQDRVAQHLARRQLERLLAIQ